MKPLKEMSIEELKEYDKCCAEHIENAKRIGAAMNNFLEVYRNRSKEENLNSILKIEEIIDLHEKQGRELDIVTTLPEGCRETLKVFKSLAKLN